MIVRWWDFIGMWIFWLLAEGAAGAMFGKFGYFTHGPNQLRNDSLGFLCVVPIFLFYRSYALITELWQLQRRAARLGTLINKRGDDGGLTDAESEELDKLDLWWKNEMHYFAAYIKDRKA